MARKARIKKPDGSFEEAEIEFDGEDPAQIDLRSDLLKLRDEFEARRTDAPIPTLEETPDPEKPKTASRIPSLLSFWRK